MAGPVFKGDPTTGHGQLEYESGVVIVGHISDFFDGRYSVRNGVITDLQQFDAVGNHIYNPISIGRAGPFSISELEDNRYNLTSTTSRGISNIRPVGDVMRLVQGPIEALSNQGNLVTVNLPPIPVNNIGHTWVAYLTEDGVYDYFNAKAIYSSTREVQAVYGPSYRLATPEEAASRAIANNLYRANFEKGGPDEGKLEQFARENGLKDEDGNPDISGAVRQLMNVGDMSQLIFSTMRVLVHDGG